MSQHPCHDEAVPHGNKGRDSRWFSFFYQTRLKAHKEEIPVLNLSLGFGLLAALSAPWLVAVGAISALALGYRLSIERNDPNFSGNFRKVIREAAENVKAAADQLCKGGAA